MKLKPRGENCKPTTSADPPCIRLPLGRSKMDSPPAEQGEYTDQAPAEERFDEEGEGEVEDEQMRDEEDAVRGEETGDAKAGDTEVRTRVFLGAEENLRQLRKAVGKFKDANNDATYAMRKKIESLMRRDQITTAELKRAHENVKTLQREDTSLRDEIHKGSIQQRNLKQEIDRLNVLCASRESEIMSLRRTLAATEDDVKHALKQKQQWESRAHDGDRRNRDAEALAGIHKAKVDGLQQSLKQTKAALQYAQQEIEQLRRSKRLQAKDNDEKVSFLMARIVQAERSAKHNAVLHEKEVATRRQMDLQRQLVDAAKRAGAERSKPTDQEQQSIVYFKRELYLLRTKYKAVETENKVLHSRVVSLEAERKKLTEQVWRLNKMATVKLPSAAYTRPPPMHGSPSAASPLSTGAFGASSISPPQRGASFAAATSPLAGSLYAGSPGVQPNVRGATMFNPGAVPLNGAGAF